MRVPNREGEETRNLIEGGGKEEETSRNRARVEASGSVDRDILELDEKPTLLKKGDQENQQEEGKGSQIKNASVHRIRSL